jgi:GTP-binding protein
MSDQTPTFLKSASKAADVLQYQKPQVAMFGRSNVGKSSLINALTGRPGLSRASRTPGRTRLINVFDAGSHLLVDLPGYGFAKAAKETTDAFQHLVIEYLDEAPIALALLVVDIRHGLTDKDQAMRTSLEGRSIPYLIVANKSDKLSRGEIAQTVKRMKTDLPQPNIFTVSTEKMTGVGELKAAILNALRKATE